MNEKLRMLDWEQKKAETNLLRAKELRSGENKVSPEKMELFKNLTLDAIGISFDELFLLYLENNEDEHLETTNLVLDILEIIELQLGGEVDEDNIVIALVMFYGTLSLSEDNQDFIPSSTTLVETVTRDQ